MLFDISHEGRTTLAVDRAGALALGYPEAVVNEAEAEARIKLIRNECRRRIYAVASAETQLNMATASAVFSSKAASARTEQEKAVLTGLQAAIDWVAAMRNNVTTIAADLTKDFTADENWPAVPAAAVAIANQF